MKLIKKRFKSPALRKAIYDENQAKQSARLDEMSINYSICTKDPEQQIDVKEFNRKNKESKMRYE